MLQIKQPNLSQHLAVLREAGIVHSTREAKMVTYYIQGGLTQRLIVALAAVVEPTGDHEEGRRQGHGAGQAALATRDLPMPAKTAFPDPGDALVFATIRYPGEPRG